MVRAPSITRAARAKLTRIAKVLAVVFGYNFSFVASLGPCMRVDGGSTATRKTHAHISAYTGRWMSVRRASSPMDFAEEGSDYCSE